MKRLSLAERGRLLALRIATREKLLEAIAARIEERAGIRLSPLEIQEALKDPTARACIVALDTPAEAVA
jgi:hypothetical protein